MLLVKPRRGNYVQKTRRKPSLHGVNEHFNPFFNDVCVILLETFARELFCHHTALKRCSIGHLLHVNFLFVRLFALPDDKLSSRAKVSISYAEASQ